MDTKPWSTRLLPREEPYRIQNNRNFPNKGFWSQHSPHPNPQQQHGKQTGENPHCKMGIPGAHPGEREWPAHKEREFQLQGLYRFFKMQKNGGKAEKSRAERWEN